MVKKIVFQTEVDASGFSRGLKVMEAASEAAQGRMNRTTYEQQRYGGMTRAQYESRAAYEAKEKHRAIRKAELEAARQSQAQSNTVIAGGKRGQFSTASSMFVSVARDSAASLASGAPAMQVFAQQAPQVLQALTMMGLALATLLKFVFPLAAVGLALAGIVMWIQRTREQMKNLKDLTDTTTVTFSRQASAMQTALDKAREFAEWLRKLGEAQGKTKDKTEEAIDALKEQHRVEMEIAQRQGKSPRQLAAMELQQLRDQLAELEKQRAIAQQQFYRNVVDAEGANQSVNDSSRTSRLAMLKDKQSELAAVVEAAQAQLKIAKPTYDPFGGEAFIPDASTKMVFTAGGREYEMSVNDAKSALDKVAAEANVLADTQSELESAAASAKDALSENSKRIKEFDAEIKATETKIGSAEKLLPFSKASRDGIPGDSLVRVGNFLGSTRGKIESLAERQANLMQRYLPMIEANTRPRQVAGSSYSPI